MGNMNNPEKIEAKEQAKSPNTLPSILPFGNIILGTVIGLLIGLPIAMAPGGFQGLLLATIPLGAITGYRHRRSRLFLYFSLICVLILSWLVSFQMVVPEA